MPILEREQSLFPDELLKGFASGNSGQRRWWAIYTRARQEKALARDLLRYKIPFFLPLIAHDRFINGRRTQSHLPLFSGYLFLFGDNEERIKTLTTSRTSRVLPVEDEAELYRDLRSINELISSGAPLTVESRLEPGDTVRVKHGLFAGLEGTITRRRGVSRLLIAVKYLQQGVSVEIDDVMVERIGRSNCA